MSILSKSIAAGVIAVAASLAASVPAQAKGAASTPCFFHSSWRGWSSPSPDVIYLDVGRRKVYRVDVLGGGYRLKSPGNYLVNQVRGSSSVCSHLDLDLAVADNTGYYMPLIARKLTLLTPEEVAAIPRKDLP